MPLQLPYKEIDLYRLAKQILHCCYEVTADLPPDVRKNLFQEMRRAALMAYLNITEGISQEKKKKKRKRLRWAKDHLLVINAILDVLVELNYVRPEQAQELEGLLEPCHRYIREATDK